MNSYRQPITSIQASIESPPSRNFVADRLFSSVGDPVRLRSIEYDSRACGKWVVPVNLHQIDFIWGALCHWAHDNPNIVYVSTTTSKHLSPADKFCVEVYTWDMGDIAQVELVRRELCGLGITWSCAYKAQESAGDYLIIEGGFLPDERRAEESCVSRFTQEMPLGKQRVNR